MTLTALFGAPSCVRAQQLVSHKPQDQKRELLFVYRPPIKLDGQNDKGKINVYYYQGRVYSEIMKEGSVERLAVIGYPPTLQGSPEELKRFFSFTYLVIEKSTYGGLSHVAAHLSGPGGVVNDQDIFPMQTGYNLGGIIKKDHVHFAILKKRSSTLENDLKNLQACKEKLKGESKGSLSIMDVKQSKLTQLNKQIGRIENEFVKVFKEMEMLSEKVDFFEIEEMLPIDHSQSRIRIQMDRSYYSEKLDHVMITNKDKGEVGSRVESFIYRLFAQDIPANFFPSSTIEGVVSNIEEVLQQESVISLVGSVITLTRSRVFDPIIFRPKAKVSEKLKKNASEYYVLSEAILGAVFLGVGKHISRTDGKEEDKSAQASEEGKKSVLSSLTMISFISQGAIPQTSVKADDANLWNVYSHWKEVLQKDEMTGYPIGFKYRELRDILAENRVAL